MFLVMFDDNKFTAAVFLLMQNVEYITLSREQILAIAARAAEIAVEQALSGRVPSMRTTPFRIKDDHNTDEKQLSDTERRIMAELFK